MRADASTGPAAKTRPTAGTSSKGAPPTRTPARPTRRTAPDTRPALATDRARELLGELLRLSHAGEDAPTELALGTDLTLAEFISIFLERHATTVQHRTAKKVAERLRPAIRDFGDVPLAELQYMVNDTAAWAAREMDAQGKLVCLDQVFTAAVNWRYVTENPIQALGKKPPRPRRSIRVFTNGEIMAIGAHLHPMYRTLPIFVCATGLRPGEWSALQPHDIEHDAGILHVRRTITLLPCDRPNCRPACKGHRGVVERGKTRGSLRRVPLTPVALAALDQRPFTNPEWVWPSQKGWMLNTDGWADKNWRRAVRAAGIRQPARMYDMRSTFATRALLAGISVFDLAHIMGTSILMIQRHYGAFLPDALTSARLRLTAHEGQADSNGS